MSKTHFCLMHYGIRHKCKVFKKFDSSIILRRKANSSNRPLFHGHGNAIGAVIFPHNIALGCTRDRALLEKIGRITAEEVRATGIQWAFGPCVPVPQDIRWGRTYEGFSEDPEVVKDRGEAAVRGLQRPDLSDPLSVLACARHYVGDGGTSAGTAPRPGPDPYRPVTTPHWC